MFLRRLHRTFPVRVIVSALSCGVISAALAGCSEDSAAPSNLQNAPTVSVQAVFTTDPDSTQEVAPLPDREPLATVALPCDGRLAVRLKYEHWDARAPWLCAETLNCGHVALKLSLDDLSSETMVVSSPALFDLRAAQPRWAGTATLEVELRKDDDSPFLVEGAPVRDELPVPLSPRDCASP